MGFSFEAATRQDKSIEGVQQVSGQGRSERRLGQSRAVFVAANLK